MTRIPSSEDHAAHGINPSVHQGPLPPSLAGIPLEQLEAPIHKSPPFRSSFSLGCWSRTGDPVIEEEDEEGKEVDEGPRVARAALPRAKKRAAGPVLSPKERSEAISKAGRARWAALTPEQRKELGQRSLRGRVAKNPDYAKSIASRTPRHPTGFTQGSEAYRAHMVAKGKESAARRTPEERSASALKSAATRRATNIDSRRQMEKTPEERKALARRGAEAMHAARRARLAGEALPETGP